MAYVREVTKLTIRSTTLAYIDYFYQQFSIGLHGVVDVEVDFEPMGHGFESRESLFLFIYFFIFFLSLLLQCKFNTTVSTQFLLLYYSL